MYKSTILLSVVLFITCLIGCDTKEMPLFKLRENTGIDFINQLSYTEDFNPYTYRNFYNGGGVALGDINNDGLIDIYLTGNLVENKLYLNQGNWKFKDITEEAGVTCPNVWSTGATFVDINGDGYLDIYVCKSGKPEGTNRNNELFINNGDLTFSEQSSNYGLDVVGLSVHAAFFDYDRDGDLDCYILNNSIRSVGGFDLIKDQRHIPDPEGNKFMKNDKGYFIDVTEEAGIYSSKIGYGLGITLSDFNKDGWTDIFISNDFFERDYLYINQKNGKFDERGEESFKSMSLGSMGADAADLDNDLNIDLFVTEMLPKTLKRKKTKAIYDSWDKYLLAQEKGYGHQFPRNVLQRNLGNNDFLEIGRSAGVAASDWSWASIMWDMDNDGLKDLFVSNGIHKDLLDRDYLAYMATDNRIKKMIDDDEEVIMNLIDLMPSSPIVNNVYRNLGNFEFEDYSHKWGINVPTFSNGSAYADLDNDGDQDLVVNNVNLKCHVYENTTQTNNSLSIELLGSEMNRQAIGAVVTIKQKGGEQMVIENYVCRGFQSSISNRMIIGVGDHEQIDTLRVEWPDGRISEKMNIAVNQLLKIDLSQASSESSPIALPTTTYNFKEDSLFSFVHRENKFNEFNRERLLYSMNGNEGPGIAVGDVNEDGHEDVFFGGAKNQKSSLFVSEGDQYVQDENSFIREESSEVTDAFFFDSDNDGHQDLYVAHGGKAFSVYSPGLHDQLYINNGQGKFTLSTEALPFPIPISTSVALPIDYNNDEFDDILVCERFSTSLYGTRGSVYILVNRGNNKFELKIHPELSNVGMIKSAIWKDVVGNSEPELILVGEWMPIKIYQFSEGEFVDISKSVGLLNTNGLWNTIEPIDIDKDGDIDLLCGNHGLNNFLTGEMKMYVQDFDNNGRQEQIITTRENGKDFPIHDMDDLVAQIPGIKKKSVLYSDYANTSLDEYFPKEILKNAEVFKLDILESTLFLNESGNFSIKTLPPEVQYSSVHAIEVCDTNNDEIEDVILGGNDLLIKPQYGRQDASQGWVIYGTTDSSEIMDFEKAHPLGIEGAIREIIMIDDQYLLIGVNDKEVKTIRINED